MAAPPFFAAMVTKPARPPRHVPPPPAAAAPGPAPARVCKYCEGAHAMAVCPHLTVAHAAAACAVCARRRARRGGGGGGAAASSSGAASSSASFYSGRSYWDARYGASRAAAAGVGRNEWFVSAAHACLFWR